MSGSSERDLCQDTPSEVKGIGAHCGDPTVTHQGSGHETGGQLVPAKFAVFNFPPVFISTSLAMSYHNKIRKIRGH